MSSNVSFKKKRPKNLRKSRVTAEKGESAITEDSAAIGGADANSSTPSSATTSDAVLPALNAHDVILEARLAREARKRQKGMEASVARDDRIMRHSTYELGIDDTALDKAFTTEVVQVDQKQLIDREMESFIEERVRVERERWLKQQKASALTNMDGQREDGGNTYGDKHGGAHASQASRQARSEAVLTEDSLYEVPSHLQAAQKDAATAEETDATAVTWVAGIEEVNLPIEFKLDNLEKTERAQRELAQRGGGGAFGRGESAPANFNSYAASRSAYHADHSRTHVVAGGGAKRSASDAAGGSRRTQASDNLAYKRFRKAELRHFSNK